jgi:hypothetical protein
MNGQGDWKKEKKGLKFHQLKILNLENCLLLDLLLKRRQFYCWAILEFCEEEGFDCIKN